MKERVGQKIKLTNYEALLGVSNEESAVDVSIRDIHSFENHPFKVVDDDKMAELVESIKVNGVLTPVLIRPSKKTRGYEMISGHRRLHAAGLAGLSMIPAIVREMDDDTAVLAMVDGEAMTEPETFVLDDIVGYYGKTKAMATQLVMDAVKNQGLRASIVYPTGICGPNDYAHGPVSTFTIQLCKGEVKKGVPGSFNSVDVRDLAAGTIACVDKGRVGEGYILGNDVVSMKEMFQYISDASGVKMVNSILPMTVAKLVVKVGVLMGKITKKEPLFTELMMYNLVRNNEFDSSKARRELGYTTRPFADTIRDEVMWLKAEGMILTDENPKEQMAQQANA